MSSPDHSWYDQPVVTSPHSHPTQSPLSSPGWYDGSPGLTSWQLWHLLQLSLHLAPNHWGQTTTSPGGQPYPSGQFYCSAIWPLHGQLNQQCLVITAWTMSIARQLGTDYPDKQLSLSLSLLLHTHTPSASKLWFISNHGNGTTPGCLPTCHPDQALISLEGNGQAGMLERDGLIAIPPGQSPWCLAPRPITLMPGEDMWLGKNVDRVDHVKPVSRWIIGPCPPLNSTHVNGSITCVFLTQFDFPHRFRFPL